ncbi:MAG: hypothetical protein ACRDN9_14890 [Streptosporangiaceae bacterium]
MSDRPAKVRAVDLLAGRQVRATVADGIVRDIDLGALLSGLVVAELRDDDAALAGCASTPSWGPWCGRTAPTSTQTFSTAITPPPTRGPTPPEVVGPHVT